ncbi:MAG: TetR/AcrR family transcriptional regulator [Bradyrhizobium sp.]
MEPRNKTVKRGRGRPQARPDEVTRRLIHEAAQQEFLESGYAATCMEAVAARAGVSTKTLYRLIPTKAALFEGMVTARLDEFFAGIVADVVDSPDLASALETMLVDCAGLTLDKEVLGVHRLVIAESDRFPELAQAFYKNGIQRVPVALAEWLDTQRKRGMLRLEDPKAAAGMLLGMMISEPQRAAILRQGKPLSPNAVRERARACAQLFLGGCAQ